MGEIGSTKRKEIRDYIGACTWIWAKTMPDMPHEYIVRGKQLTDEQFVSFIHSIRQFGKKEQWGRYNHEYLYIDGYKYWTMGAPVEKTTIINRAKVFNEYDKIADVYDGLFAGNGFSEEDKQVVEMLRWDRKLFDCGDPILDIGCGTGLLIDLLKVMPNFYVGIDPSASMLSQLRQKHPHHTVINKPYEEVMISNPDYYAISLYGSPSYIMPQYLSRINQFKRHFLMFYKPDYIPITYIKAKVKFTHFLHDCEGLRKIFPDSKIIEFNNYLIVMK